MATMLSTVITNYNFSLQNGLHLYSNGSSHDSIKKHYLQILYFTFDDEICMILIAHQITRLQEPQNALSTATLFISNKTDDDFRIKLSRSNALPGCISISISNGQER